MRKKEPAQNRKPIFKKEAIRKMKVEFLDEASKAQIKKLGCNIRELRNKIGMTQFGLATAAMISRHTVASIETGRQDTPISLLARLAIALEVDHEDLLGRSPRWEIPVEQEIKEWKAWYKSVSAKK